MGFIKALESLRGSDCFLSQSMREQLDSTLLLGFGSNWMNGLDAAEERKCTFWMGGSYSGTK